MAYYIRASLMPKNILYIYKGTYVYLCIKLMHPRMLHKKILCIKLRMAVHSDEGNMLCNT